ncbi:MAG: FKBP-type peptidyl-prolyl cis-trans isomerase N-terminal domain-containing protein [Nitrospiraceae bacterium]|nr:FKBP-type peptidyl-prolyl cis-trans isomerase N-terminal domain-containing protein [Nitrospiraceae bacterium]
MMIRTMILGAAILGLLSSPVLAEDKGILRNGTDRESYSTGVAFVNSLKQQGGSLNLDMVIQGIRDGLTGESLLMSGEEIQRTLAALRSLRQADPQKLAAPRETEKALAGGAPGNATAMDASVPAQTALPKEQQDGGVMTTMAKGGASPGTQQAPYGAQVGGSGTAQAGPTLSFRNQAKLNVQEMKAQMRASLMQSGQ